MPRALSKAEIDDLLMRNFELRGRVLQHERFAYQWDQIKMQESVFGALPIPTKGLAVRDDRYGVVVVFPDAAGRLHYSAELPAAVLSSDIQKPAFHSPSGNSLTEFFSDVQKSIGNFSRAVYAGALVLGVVFVWRATK